MKSNCILLRGLFILAALLPPAFALPPGPEAAPAEARFVSEFGFRSWQARREKLQDAADHLNGSEPVNVIRTEIRKAIKDTQAYMKNIHELDERETIPMEMREAYRERADILAGRFEALAQSLSHASISPEASPKQHLKWSESRKEVLAQLHGARDILQETAASLEKMRTET